tara:strand:- start:2005 stop:2322 length:318 start_codon:yes stop_codon:yes gene_type:complete
VGSIPTSPIFLLTLKEKKMYDDMTYDEYENEFSEEDEERERVYSEWTRFVKIMFGANPDNRAELKNPTREFILQQREHMAELGTECTPDEVAALLRLISDTMDMD